MHGGPGHQPRDLIERLFALSAGLSHTPYPPFWPSVALLTHSLTPPCSPSCPSSPHTRLSSRGRGAQAGKREKQEKPPKGKNETALGAAGWGSGTAEPLRPEREEPSARTRLHGWLDAPMPCPSHQCPLFHVPCPGSIFLLLHALSDSQACSHRLLHAAGCWYLTYMLAVLGTCTELRRSDREPKGSERRVHATLAGPRRTSTT